METLTIEAVREGVPKYAGLSLSKADFLQWESDDDFFYEWNDGILEPMKGMQQNELFIISNIEDKFFETETFKKKKGRLFSEIDCWLTEKQMRRPDMAFYTAEQIKDTAQNKVAIPSFVVEIISEHDDIRKAEIKLREYFKAGVQVVWRVLPEVDSVYVFTSPKTVGIYSDTDIITAAPAIPDLTMAAEDLFNI